MPQNDAPWPEKLLAQIGNGMCLRCDRALDDHDGLLNGRPVCPVRPVRP